MRTNGGHMMMLMMVERRAAFDNVTDTVDPLAKLSIALAASSTLGGAWTRSGGEVLALDASTIDGLLSQGPWFRADLPNQPTHVFPLSAYPTGPGEIGVLSVTIGAAPEADA